MIEERPLPPCDLVLKGGITSGVVYPRAISRLARSYQIKGVGGTSAGAIAAAFAAAAEYRRRKAGTFDGFEEVECLVADLATKVDGQTRLEGLLQPQRGTRLPFRFLKFLLSASRVKKMAVFSLLPLALLWIAVWTGVSLFETTFHATPGFLEKFGFAASYVVWLVTMLFAFKRFLGHLVSEFCRQDYGLCRGFDPRNRSARRPQLTEWVHKGLQRTAGLQEHEPLTFAHLEATGDFLTASGSRVLGSHLDKKDRIRLRLVTTCLTHSRPYTLPFQEDKFYFKPAEFLELFPESVVDWMVKNSCSESIEITPQEGKPFRLYPLPEHGHLPVVVAVRMSLSMPIILSAINLYCQDKAHPDNLPEKAIFTDGGIVSNFPIHFFDEFVPRYPTFGLNLIFAKRELSQVHHLLLNLQTQVFGKSLCEVSPVLADMAKCLLEHWDRRPGLGGFLEGIYDTARGWKDNTQLRLPGYRDRIQDIYLDPRREGGVHLSMSPEQIEALARKGEEAVEELLSKFASSDGKASPSWKNHVWTRYRITMFLLSQKLQMLQEVLVEHNFQELLFSAARESVGFHFGADNQECTDWKGDWCDAGRPPCPESHQKGLAQATQATIELVDFLQKWDSTVFQRSNLPMPLPTMRMAKEV
jgi:predicted acylesterase/phospholipase RssA